MDAKTETNVNDRFTFDVIENALQAVSDEMFAAMRKTAMSAIIYEVLDMGTGITDADRRDGLVGRRDPGLHRRSGQVGDGDPAGSSPYPGY